MIRVWYTELGNRLSEAEMQPLLGKLSPAQVEEVLRYHRWQDRQRSLFGRLLIRHALLKHDYPPSAFFQLKKEENGRPFIEGLLDFNISHSGEYVVCAATEEGRVGIDVEQIREMKFRDLHIAMTPLQWETINAADEPRDEFFRFWAIKESVIKADGIGLSLRTDELEVEDKWVQVKTKRWYYSELDIAPGHACCLAYDQEEISVEVEKLNLLLP